MRWNTPYFTAVVMLFWSFRSLSAAVAKKIPKMQLPAVVQRLGKTPQQQVYLEYLQQTNVSMVLAVGCAGTGKTWLACHEAAKSLQRGDVDRIVLTRPIVPVEGEEGLGFLPGSLESKMDPWTRPMLDVLRPLLSPTVLQKQVEMIPLMYMRGRTFDRTFVIADEMQNSTPEQMLMLVTRIGNYSRLVVTGDPQQTDRVTTMSTFSTTNGLSDLVHRLQQQKKTLSQIRIVQLTAKDVQRSALVSELLEHVYQQPPPPPPTEPPSEPPKGEEKTVANAVAAVLSKRPDRPERNNNDCALIIDDPYLRRKAV